LDGLAPGISDLQQSLLNVYFNEGIKGTYEPRAALFDLEPMVLDACEAGPLGHLYQPDNILSGIGGAGNNWSKGYYTKGADMIEPCLDIIRLEAECADRMQGLQLCHSLGGGTGSGFGSLLTQKLNELFPKTMVQTFSIFPSTKVSDTITEPYNAVLSMQYLVDEATSTVVLDNEALFDICKRKLKIDKPTYGNINRILAESMSGTTCSMRFPGQINSTMRKLATNLIPFPRIKFLMSSFAPIVPEEEIKYINYDVKEMLTSMIKK